MRRKVKSFRDDGACPSQETGLRDKVTRRLLVLRVTMRQDFRAVSSWVSTVDS
jgi:hypothetical protein